MAKSPDAFRTISEVADWLDTPAHVLRFWESKFSQVKPVKRAGGRRYYRPSDMALLAGIKKLLHDDGMTIKGAQKVLREKGVKYVSALSPLALDDGGQESQAVIEDAPFAEAVDPPETVVPFAKPAAPKPVTKTPAAEETPQPVAADEDTAPPVDDAPVDAAEPVKDAQQVIAAETAAAPVTPKSPAPDAPELPFDLPAAAGAAPESAGDTPTTTPPPSDEMPAAALSEPDEDLPEFLSKSLDDRVQEHGTAPPEPIAIPPDPDLDAIEVAPGVLSHLAQVDQLTADQAQAILPLVRQLRELTGRLGGPGAR